MKHIRGILIALFVTGLVGYFVIPALFFSSGVWHRRVVRDNPLKAPILIKEVQGDTLISARDEFRLAGIALPTDPAISARATEFLRVVTAQGIEVIRKVQPGGAYILRCEPRIFHWCGNDSVAAHYQQFNLNELIVAFGCATADSATTGLAHDERLRLQAAEMLAKQYHRGMWTEQTDGIHRGSFRPESGINISDALDLATMIELTAENIANQR